jgi:hypothetical protein
VNGGDTRVNFGIGSAATASTAADAQVTLRVTSGKGVLGAHQTLRGLDAVTTNAGDQEIDLAGNFARVYPADRNAEELSIYNDIKAARNSASGRDGIYDSTTPSADYSVGVTDQATDAHGDPHVLVRLTRNGDANVDGQVNLQDFNRLASFFGQSNQRWDNGDFNFDGTVNLQDFNRLAANFGLQAGPDGPTPEDWAALGAAVPEPGSAGAVLVFSSALLAGRRRRRA